MNEILRSQLSLDYCVLPGEVEDCGQHFTVFREQPGQRQFDATACGREMFLKIAVVHGTILATGREEIIGVLPGALADREGQWLFDGNGICLVNRLIQPYGYRVRSVHPFYLSDTPSVLPDVSFETVFYDETAIRQFRGDGRFDEAYGFSPFAPDVIGVAAVRNGEILGMAGASADSPSMWQIGINVLPGHEGKEIGSYLVACLKNKVLASGHLPFYGTAMSHIASQRVAQKAGFVPAWAELITEKEN